MRSITLTVGAARGINPGFPSWRQIHIAPVPVLRVFSSFPLAIALALALLALAPSAFAAAFLCTKDKGQRQIVEEQSTCRWVPAAPQHLGSAAIDWRTGARVSFAAPFFDWCLWGA